MDGNLSIISYDLYALNPFQTFLCKIDCAKANVFQSNENFVTNLWEQSSNELDSYPYLCSQKNEAFFVRFKKNIKYGRKASSLCEKNKQKFEIMHRI